MNKIGERHIYLVSVFSTSGNSVQYNIRYHTSRLYIQYKSCNFRQPNNTSCIFTFFSNILIHAYTHRINKYIYLLDEQKHAMNLNESASLLEMQKCFHRFRRILSVTNSHKVVSDFDSIRGKKINSVCKWMRVDEKQITENV